MARYNGNSYYLSIDGTDVSSYAISCSITPTMDAVETTAGSNTEFRTRNEGLRDVSISFSLAYDTAARADLFSLTRPGKHTVIFGEEGTDSGLPKHEQDFIFGDNNGLETTVEKDFVVFDVSGDSAAAPVSNMYAGDTWA